MGASRRTYDSVAGWFVSRDFCFAKVPQRPRPPIPLVSLTDWIPAPAGIAATAIMDEDQNHPAARQGRSGIAGAAAPAAPAILPPRSSLPCLNAAAAGCDDPGWRWGRTTP